VRSWLLSEGGAAIAEAGDASIGAGGSAGAQGGGRALASPQVPEFPEGLLQPLALTTPNNSGLIG
jgi:hypothetical protein